MTLVDDVRAMLDTVNALRPCPSRIMASHAVPYGRAYRQWNTRGELLLWVNRGLIADLPRRPADRVGVLTGAGALGFTAGIPVVNV
jgi:hypothetical protein